MLRDPGEPTEPAPEQFSPGPVWGWEKARRGRGAGEREAKEVMRVGVGDGEKLKEWVGALKVGEGPFVLTTGYAELGFRAELWPGRQCPFMMLRHFFCRGVRC